MWVRKFTFLRFFLHLYSVSHHLRRPSLKAHFYWLDQIEKKTCFVFSAHHLRRPSHNALFENSNIESVFWIKINSIFQPTIMLSANLELPFLCHLHFRPMWVTKLVFKCSLDVPRFCKHFFPSDAQSFHVAARNWLMERKTVVGFVLSFQLSKSNFVAFSIQSLAIHISFPPKACWQVSTTVPWSNCNRNKIQTKVNFKPFTLRTNMVAVFCKKCVFVAALCL